MKVKSPAQRRFKAQSFMLAGLSLFMPIGYLFVNFYGIFSTEVNKFTLVMHTMIGVVCLILGTHFLVRGERMLKGLN